jgi:hypothetical protein
LHSRSPHSKQLYLCYWAPPWPSPHLALVCSGLSRGQLQVLNTSEHPLEHLLALHLLALHPQEHPLVLHTPEHPLVLHPLKHPMIHPLVQPLVLHPLERPLVLHPPELHLMEHLLEHLLELHLIGHSLDLLLPPPRSSHQLTSSAWRTSWLPGSSRATSPPPAARSH